MVEERAFTRDIVETAEVMANTLIPSNRNDVTEYIEDPTTIYDINPCDSEELKITVWKRSPTRAPGVDCIRARMVRKAWPHVAPAYLQLVNECLYNDTFPEPWKTADVVPLLKKPDLYPAIPKSYRPVSLLPVMTKALGGVICNRLSSEIEPTLSGKQFGFTKGLSLRTPFRHCFPGIVLDYATWRNTPWPYSWTSPERLTIYPGANSMKIPCSLTSRRDPSQLRRAISAVERPP